MERGALCRFDVTTLAKEKVLPPTVACIIPTHGRPDQLSRSLESVLQQTAAPAEIVVVDDLDDERTAAVVRLTALRTEIPMRRIVNKAHPGASGSRNAGTAASTAEFIAFLDDDDAWRPEHLARAAAELARSEADAAVSGLCRIRHDGSTQDIVMPPPAAIREQLFDRNFGMTGSNLVIRRAAFDRIGGFDVALPVFNDWDLVIRMVVGGIGYCVVRDLTVEWREHEGDRISTPTLRRAAGIERFVAKHGAIMPPLNRRNLMADALGIRWRNAGSTLSRVVLMARLLRLLGPREAIGRRLGLIRRKPVEAGC
jgi:glycosyltransferase involved in cell wall biosynthesis